MSVEDLITYGTRRERRAIKRANKSFKPKNKRAAAINSLRKRKVHQTKENMAIKTAGGNDDSD